MISANNFEQIRFAGMFDIIIAKKSDEKKGLSKQSK